MILGVTTSTFTFVHVLLSLAGIGSGFIVVFGLLTGKRLDGWTALFLTTTVATTVTGFLFPFHKLLPSHKVGISTERRGFMPTITTKDGYGCNANAITLAGSSEHLRS